MNKSSGSKDQATPIRKAPVQRGMAGEANGSAMSAPTTKKPIDQPSSSSPSSDQVRIPSFTADTEDPPASARKERSKSPDRQALKNRVHPEEDKARSPRIAEATLRAERVQRTSHARNNPSSTMDRKKARKEIFDKTETFMDPPSAGAGRRRSLTSRHTPVMNFPVPATKSQARTQKEVNRELNNLRNQLKKHARGKPTRPVHMMTIPAVIGRSIGRTIKILALLLILTILLVGGTGVGMIMGYLATTDKVKADELVGGTETSQMLDSQGNVIGKFTGRDNVDRMYVPFGEIKSTYIDEAFKAIEDERFDSNIGIDPRRILSAIVSALANGGQPTHGGSTITQQTVKMLTGENQVSAQRKVQEWWKAIMLNQDLTKDEIMDLYLNNVPMANSYVGIQTAAQAYFDKNAKDLTLEECAYLAGVPKAPSLYNPRTESGLRNGLRRQRIVLRKMFDLKMISQEQYTNALNSELAFRQTPPKVSGTSINSYFVEYAFNEVVEDLMAAKGYSRAIATQIISSKGVTIHSTLEPEVQSIVDQAMLNSELWMPDPSLYIDWPEKPQAGQAVINNRTGAIAALGGGTGEKKGNLWLNHATDIERQPGSSIKPLVSYAPAFETGAISPSTVFRDEPVFLDPQRPTTPYPKNAGGLHWGVVTARNALKLSLNIESARVLAAVGVDVGKQYLAKVGIDRTQDPVGIAIAMGAPTQGMSPLEMASGYSVFPNGGMWTPPSSYTKVVARDGTVLLSKEPNFTQVYKPETAYLITSILKETMWGGNSSYNYPGLAARWGELHTASGEVMPSSAKSGTTEWQEDHWFCGYTPYYTTAVWYGFDTPKVLGDQEIYHAEDIYFDTMNKIHANLEAVDFTRPGSIVSKNICVVSGKLANPECGGHTFTEFFDPASPATPIDYCPLHKYVAPTTTSKSSEETSSSTTAPTQSSP